MKRAVIAIVISLVVVCGMMVAEFIINSDFIDVDTVSVATSTIEDYIELTGDVKERNKQEIRYDFPVNISKIFVEVGEEVSKGEKLMSLDKTSLMNRFEMAKAESSDSETYDKLISSLEHSPESICSPIDGVVSELYVSENSEVPLNSPVITITDMENLVIRSKISNESFKEIALGQKAYIYSDNSIQEGKISKIYPTAERKDGESVAWVSFEIEPEDSSSLKCGTVVNIRVCNEIFKDILTVPFDSIMFDEDKPYVYVDMSGFAVKRRVVLGKEFETEVEIKSGLTVNDKLIKSPKQLDLKNGDKVYSGEE